MVTHISHSPAETESIAAAFANTPLTGCVIGLSGDLGSGKTQFVRGFARGLNVTERIHSPTFALLHIYTTGRVPLFHIDLYRLQSDEQIIAAGLTVGTVSDTTVWDSSDGGKVMSQFPSAGTPVVLGSSANLTVGRWGGANR